MKPAWLLLLLLLLLLLMLLLLLLLLLSHIRTHSLNTLNTLNPLNPLNPLNTLNPLNPLLHVCMYICTYVCTYTHAPETSLRRASACPWNDHCLEVLPASHVYWSAWSNSSTLPPGSFLTHPIQSGIIYTQSWRPRCVVLTGKRLVRCIRPEAGRSTQRRDESRRVE
jgi:hypothetical protein